MKTYVKDWYLANFPTDGVGQDIDPDVQFIDCYEAILNDENIYEIIGVNDSLVRERIFDELNKLTDNDIYEIWISNDN